MVGLSLHKKPVDLIVYYQGTRVSDFKVSESKVQKMICTKKITQMARKWQRQATNRRKRIPLRRAQEDAAKQEGCSAWTKAEKGHFVVYSVDKRRFVLPLVYLKNNIFRELFTLAEEEFGLSCNVPLTLPCDATVIEYVITLI